MNKDQLKRLKEAGMQGADLSPGDELSALAYAEIVRARELIIDLCYQFGDRGTKNRQCVLGTSGLSALEDAFAYLGWDQPHPIPDEGCQHKGCYQPATCGTPTGDGYKRLCYDHFKLVARPRPIRVK